MKDFHSGVQQNEQMFSKVTDRAETPRAPFGTRLRARGGASVTRRRRDSGKVEEWGSGEEGKEGGGGWRQQR